MPLPTETTASIVKKYATGLNDTGSPQVQVALITARLEMLNGHFTTHVKDHHSRRGLLRLVSQRRRLLKYLERTNKDAYKSLIADLGLRK